MRPLKSVWLVLAISFVLLISLSLNIKQFNLSEHDPNAKQLKTWDLGRTATYELIK